MTMPAPKHARRWGRFTGAVAARTDALAIVAGAMVAVPLAVAAVNASGAPGWLWWQWLVVLALAADLGGGMVANNLPTIKRGTHHPGRRDWSLLGFVAIHLHLPVLALAVPDAMPQGAAWMGYCWLVGGAFVLLAVPDRLRLGLATLLTLVGTVLIAHLVPLDGPIGWMPMALMLKLLVGHMVGPEES